MVCVRRRAAPTLNVYAVPGERPANVHVFVAHVAAGAPAGLVMLATSVRPLLIVNAWVASFCNTASGASVSIPSTTVKFAELPGKWFGAVTSMR